MGVLSALGISGNVSAEKNYSSGSSNSTTSGQESGVQTTTRLDANTLAAVQALLGTATKDASAAGGQYSKDQAVADSQGLVANLFKQYSQVALPQILSKQGATQGYDSTTAQLLANDAFSSTIAKAADVQAGMISSYAATESTKKKVANESIATLLQTLLASKETTSLDKQLNSNTGSSFKGQTTKIGTSLNLG